MRFPPTPTTLKAQSLHQLVKVSFFNLNKVETCLKWSQCLAPFHCTRDTVLELSFTKIWSALQKLLFQGFTVIRRSAHENAYMELHFNIRIIFVGHRRAKRKTKISKDIENGQLLDFEPRSQVKQSTYTRTFEVYGKNLRTCIAINKI